MSRWKKWTILLRDEAEKEPVPIVSDAAVATRGVADGRMIPVLIIDTSNRPDIEDMIRAHEHLGSGDVTSGWWLPSRFDKSRVGLILTVTKPSRCVIILEFGLPRQGGVVDQIINAQGVYLLPGKKGDRFSSTMEKGRLLIEVPSRDFRKEWDRIFRKALYRDFKKGGLGRQKANLATEKFLQTWRQLSAIRMDRQD